MGEPPKTGRMNGESKDGPERSSRGAGWVWLCWVGAILLLYVLSTGPVVLLYDKKLIQPGSPGLRAVQIVYWPLDWVCGETPLRKPLGMYWHFWAPQWFDRQGNPTPH